LVIEPTFANQYRDIINLIEHELTEVLTRKTPLSAPNRGRLSRMSRTFPIVPSVDLRPDEKARYFVLSISANDRNGLLYTVANILAKYKIHLHTAKIMTLGERVEDVFLLDGPYLQNAKINCSSKPNFLMLYAFN